MNQPPSSTRQRSIALAVFFYRWLLMLYPRSFRQRYGAQMLQVFRDSCREARQARGLRGLLGLWLWTLADLCKTALAERLAIARPLARPAAIRLCGLIALGTSASLLLLRGVVFAAQMGLPLPFLASLPESVWTSLYNLPLLNTLTVCSSIGGLLGLLLVQRNRGGRVLASLALLAEVMLLAGAYLYPIFLTVSRNLLPNYLAWAFFTATSLLTAAGVIGCGLLMSRPRWLTPFSCLLLLLGLSLGIAWTPTILLLLRAGGLAISTVSSILFPTSLSLVATLMWAALGYALFIWRDAPLIRSQPMTN